MSRVFDVESVRDVSEVVRFVVETSDLLLTIELRSFEVAMFVSTLFFAAVSEQSFRR